MDGDARPPSNRTAAQEASNINGNKNANHNSDNNNKQVKLKETLKSKSRKTFHSAKGE